ncbi:MAG: DUF1799 domain-containing protein [Rhodocyclaceae bacterium]|nr:DUF1799 domain-containing protein [Rhodocyclaceae bacterium]
MAAFGLARKRAEPETLELWPENLSSVRVFQALGTQWNLGALGGVIGLRYEALPVVLRLTGIPRSEWPDVFEGLWLMERVALEIWNS